MIVQNHPELVKISEEKNETESAADLDSQNDHQCRTLTENTKQLSPMEWWKDKLKSPRFVLAPMVDASELAWRLLARKHGADLTYSPMFHACLFAKDPIYRERAMQTCTEDRPFIVQFCANDPDQLVEAGLLVQDHCDAVDINLGCPQAIARRGRYGAFLQDDWDLISKMVSSSTKALSVPVTCKVRVFEDIERTVSYAKMLESSGAFALTVHGRTREQKGPATGKANWDYIRAVRHSVQIPVIANGNIECVEDVYMCFQQTDCHAVMTAEGSLHNPAVFHTSAVAVSSEAKDSISEDSMGVTKRRDIRMYETALKNMNNDVAKKDEGKVPWPDSWTVGPPPPVWEPGLEYLELVSEYPCPFSYIRGHLFKLLHHCLCLPANYDLRTDLAKSSTLDEFKAVVINLKDRFLPYHLGKKKWLQEDDADTKVNTSPDGESRSSPWPWYPPWLCQPYIRPTLAELSNRLEHRKTNVSQGDESILQINGTSINREHEEIVLPMKRPHPPDVEDKGDGRGFGVLSKRKLRQMQKKAKGGGGGSRAGLPRCALCLNPMGLKCAFKFCRSCCKIKCIDEILDCEGHRFMVKSKKIRHQKITKSREGAGKEVDIPRNHETLKCCGEKYNSVSEINESGSEIIVPVDIQPREGTTSKS